MKSLLKRLSFLLLIVFLSQHANAQFLKGIKDRAREKVRTKANEKVDNTIDKGLNKASEKIDTAVKNAVQGNDDNPSAGPGQLVKIGKYITTQIKFDEGSDQVKGESFILLKEVADILKQNVDMRVKIVSHTDTDGDADANLNLSKLRAASIKSQLSTVFGIDEGRLESDGEGGNNPVSKNKSEEGKAMNRRVEFIKL